MLIYSRVYFSCMLVPGEKERDNRQSQGETGRLSAELGQAEPAFRHAASAAPCALSLGS